MTQMHLLVRIRPTYAISCDGRRVEGNKVFYKYKLACTISGKEQFYTQYYVLNITCTPESSTSTTTTSTTLLLQALLLITDNTVEQPPSARV